MAGKKAFPLRISEDIWLAVRRWSDDELRSVNGQIEYILRDALRKAGRLPKGPPWRSNSSPAQSQLRRASMAKASEVWKCLRFCALYQVQHCRFKNISFPTSFLIHKFSAMSVGQSHILANKTVSVVTRLVLACKIRHWSP